ncbi:MAG: hypothetical protein U0232_23805 [Thermomicrobiales bacterium]
MVGHGDVLGGVVAAQLVVGAAVGGAEEEAFVARAAGLDAEGEADEAAREAEGVGAGTAISASMMPSRKWVLAMTAMGLPPCASPRSVRRSIGALAAMGDDLAGDGVEFEVG